MEDETAAGILATSVERKWLRWDHIPRTPRSSPALAHRGGGGGNTQTPLIADEPQGLKRNAHHRRDHVSAYANQRSFPEFVGAGGKMKTHGKDPEETKGNPKLDPGDFSEVWGGLVKIAQKTEMTSPGYRYGT